MINILFFISLDALIRLHLQFASLILHHSNHPKKSFFCRFFQLWNWAKQEDKISVFVGAWANGLRSGRLWNWKGISLRFAGRIIRGLVDRKKMAQSGIFFLSILNNNVCHSDRVQGRGIPFK